MRKVFIDSELNNQFIQEGYVVLPLLDVKETADLLHFYKEEPNDIQGGFQSSHFSKDRDYKKKVHDRIVQAYFPKLETLLEVYEAVFANFMVKQIGPESRMPLHADWTYVDEYKFISLGVWSPLVDTTVDNGRLGVIPKSQGFRSNHRGPQIPSLFNENNVYLIENYGELLEVKAGQVVIYNHKLLHFSPPNQSNTERPAINLVLAPSEAKLSHYAIIPPDKEVSVFEVMDPEFFLNYDHFERPDNAVVIGKEQAIPNEFSRKEIDDLLNPGLQVNLEQSPNSKSSMSRLYQWIKSKLNA